jgi:fatty-acyl-CoA synthase
VKVNTVGKPWPGVGIKLIGEFPAEDGCLVGEICVRGYNVMKGYYKDPEATAKAVDREGWLHTGDLGVIRKDGNLAIRGRAKDLIICKGENISPRGIEAFLKNHCAVKEAIVVGAKDYRQGESIHAFVMPVSGGTVREEELIDYCRGRLASIKIPSRIHIVEEFPSSPTGKILRSELRAIAQEIHDKERGDEHRGDHHCKRSC